MARTSPRRSGLPVESMVDALGHRSALRLAMAFGGKSIDLSTAGGKATEELKAAIGEDGLASLRTVCGTRSAKVPMPDIVVLFIMEDKLSPIDRLTISRRWGGQYLYVPVSGASAYNPIRLAFGTALAGKLAALFGGLTIPVPEPDEAVPQHERNGLLKCGSGSSGLEDLGIHVTDDDICAECLGDILDLRRRHLDPE